MRRRLPWGGACCVLFVFAVVVHLFDVVVQCTRRFVSLSISRSNRPETWSPSVVFP